MFQILVQSGFKITFQHFFLTFIINTLKQYRIMFVYYESYKVPFNRYDTYDLMLHAENHYIMLKKKKRISTKQTPFFFFFVKCK